MQAQKIMVNITVEVLSKDSVPALIEEAVKAIRKEVESGRLQMDDGDRVVWETTKSNVNF